MTKILAVPGEGERLDRFELVAELASGGMATVYLARFVGVAGFQRFVAIKRLHPHLAKDQDFIQMFLDEARLAARLHHPNVVPILEIGVHDEQYYLVMEYIEGDTVGHLMARAEHSNRKIPVPIVIRIMLDTLTGLNAAHDLTDEDGSPLEIVHRDVSPQNILVGVDGVARITDFGVAKAQARLANATQGGQLKGKLAYMAPEQVRGNATVDRRADVFAAAIVLWELFTGQRLFKAEGEAETLFKVIAAEVPPIRNYEPGVPPEVEVVVRRALAANPNDRFASTADFAEALEQAARTYNLVATVRTTATFVNEMIGLDISQQREIVRAWIGRSELSKSGVARAPALPVPEQPEAPTPVAGAPAANLSSLVDDDLDMATRVDDGGVPIDNDAEDELDQTRVGASPMASGANPAIPPSSPLLSVGNPGRAPYQSLATAREFQPLGAQPNEQALGSTLPSNVGSPAPSGALPPAPVAYPWTAIPPKTAPVKQGGLPVWTLLIPAILIIGGAVFLGMKQRQQPAPPPPAPTMTQRITTTTDDVQPTMQPQWQPPPPQQQPIPTQPVAVQTATPEPTVTAHSGPTTRPIYHPKPVTTAVDNKEFGGRK
jgi:serine/threonine-protein kinase